MSEETTTQEHLIDAKGKRLGRVASEAASYLLGKHDPAFVRHQVRAPRVKITNVRLLDLSEKRKEREVYKTYSGYPSGQKEETLGHLAVRRGYAEVVRRTIAGMLPKNKLHKERMRNLEIID